MADNSTTERIIVGVDGSETSIAALRQAARMAAAFDAPLDAVTTWEYPPSVVYYPMTDWSPEEDAKEILATAIDQAFDGSPPPNLTAHVRPGPAAAALIDESKTAGLLVLGSRGHGGFVGMLLGSVSTACVHHAHCPVLIVRPPRPETAEGAATE